MRLTANGNRMIQNPQKALCLIDRELLGFVFSLDFATAALFAGID